MSSNAFIDGRDLKKVADQLKLVPKEIPGATASAINRTLDYTATQVKKEVTKVYAIKQGEVAATITKKKASKSDLNAYIQSKGRTIKLSKFPFNPKSSSKRGRKVKVKVKKQEGYKTLNTSPSAFVQNIGGINIWKRKGKKRFPVKVLSSLSVPQMVSSKEIMPIIEKKSAEKLQERVEHEIEWRLNK